MGMADHDRVEVQYEPLGDDADELQPADTPHEPIEGIAKEPQPESPSILTFANADGFELSFKLRRNIKMGKPMKAFATRVGVQRDTLRFVYEGWTLADGATMESVSFTCTPPFAKTLSLMSCDRWTWRMGAVLRCTMSKLEVASTQRWWRAS